MKKTTKFDRKKENVGNVLNMEHINLTVPDQQLAAVFYVSGLGFTRDPYVDLALSNMWVNTGEQQIHLPKNTAQKWRGHIAVVVPKLEELKKRFNRIEKLMDQTQFAWEEQEDHFRVTCPWGNDIRVYGPNKFPGRYLGIPYAEMLVAPNTSEGIARFYENVLGTKATIIDNDEGKRAEVSMGFDQRLVYMESDSEIAEYDGHHIAIYIADFSRPYNYLRERGLITEETNQHQYRFQEIVDPENGETMTELEHEVRSLKHPMYNRKLVNRNSEQTLSDYTNGQDAFYPG